MAESELIREARKGDSTSFSRLYYTYQPVVFKIQRKYYVKDLDADDWQQEGQLVFFKTLRNYDETRGVTLGYFFKINFERHVYSLLRHQGAEKRKAWLESQPLENNSNWTSEFELAQKFLYENSSFQYVYIREALADFATLLSAFECQVFLLHLAGTSRQVISQRLGVTYEQVNNALDRIKGKFKRLIR